MLCLFVCVKDVMCICVDLVSFVCVWDWCILFVCSFGGFRLCVDLVCFRRQKIKCHVGVCETTDEVLC